MNESRFNFTMLKNVVKVIQIGEEFSKWLEEMSERYDMDKDDIQELIKQLLQ